ncbi:MAG: 16S rRNA (uracil(1498)-N(3))-methyltransferase [Planctomycetes bacterium]|nr:16S rRNA (uracil(1498)-N(3))-methyltransferase [Planctomycetota bacterium]
MSVPRLFCPDLHEGPVRLPDEEAQHAVASLRLQPGDPVELFDGRGRRADGQVHRAVAYSLEVEAGEITARPFDIPVRITLAVAMPRTHRQGYLVEKCTELGVAAIWPITTERSVTRPKAAAVAKWARRAVEAAKQSNRYWLPGIEAPQPLAASIARRAEFDSAAMAHPGALSSFVGFFAGGSRAGSVIVWIGPEGGWSEAETDEAVAAGVTLTGLGPTILRTETAAVSVCAAVALLGN